MTKSIKSDLNLIKKIHRSLKKGGLEAALQTWDEEKNNRLDVRVVDWLDKNLYGIYPVLKNLVLLNNDIPSSGLQKASEKFLERIGIKVVQVNKNGTLDKKGKGVLLYANHELAIDPFILSSLIQRNDINILAIQPIMYFGKNIGSFLIPIMPRKYALTKKPNGLKDRFHPALSLYRAERMKEHEINKLNERSMKIAVDKLLKGEVVIIFPMGGGRIDKKWQKGIGEVVKNLINSDKENSKKIILLPCLINGISVYDVFKSARKCSKGKNETLKKLNIYFGTEIELDTLSKKFRKFSSEEITDFLKREALREFAKKRIIALNCF